MEENVSLWKGHGLEVILPHLLLYDPMGHCCVSEVAGGYDMPSSSLLQADQKVDSS